MTVVDGAGVVVTGGGGGIGRALARRLADALWDAMAEGRFLVLPHPEVRDYYAARATDTDRWLRGDVPAPATDRRGSATEEPSDRGGPVTEETA